MWDTDSLNIASIHMDVCYQEFSLVEINEGFWIGYIYHVFRSEIITTFYRIVTILPIGQDIGRWL